VLIDYEKLQRCVGAGSYEELKRSHKGWVEEYWGGGERSRQEEWTRNIAVGDKSFVENVKAQLANRAKGREVREGDEGYQLREGCGSYKARFGAEKGDIELENTYFWGISGE